MQLCVCSVDKLHQEWQSKLLHASYTQLGTVSWLGTFARVHA